jgi:GTP cyclohydrolase I
VTLNMPADILRGLTRDDASAQTHPAPDIDIPAAEDAVRPLLVALGQDPEAEHLRQTPRRVAAAFSELLTPGDFELTTFANEQGYDLLLADAQALTVTYGP